MSEENDVQALSPEQPITEAQAPEEVTESTEGEATETEATAQDKQDPWYKRRIDELTRDKHEARRQSERLEKVLAQQEEMLQRLQPRNEPEAPKFAPPNPADFAGGQYDPRYIDAMMQYTRVSAIQEAKQAVAAEYEQREQHQRMVAQQAKLETAENVARAKYPDYDSVIETITSDPRLANNPTIRQALLGLDNGPDIAYQLGRDPSLAYEIANMNPIQAGMKLAALIRPEATGGRSAPTPIKPITGTGASSGKLDPATMSTKDYIAYMNNKEAEARRARQTR